MSTFLIIGRDAASSALSITVDNNKQVIGSPGSVPKSVSRQHCQLTISDDGTMSIKNLNPQNVTYVNGVAVISKTLTRSDTVKLGSERYALTWDKIDKVMPKVVDIRPLKKVWDKYNNDMKALAQSTQRFQVIRGIVPVLTMSAVLIGYLSGGRSMFFYIIYGLVIALTIFFSWKAWRDIVKNDERKERIKDRFTHDYCCPQCGYFFGLSDYNILTRNIDNCPKCRAKLRK